MKNFKVSQKLMCGFLITVLLCGIVGVIGIVGININRASITSMYNEQTLPLEYLAQVKETLVSMRMYVRDMVIYSMKEDRAGVDRSFGLIEGCIPVMENALNTYQATIKPGSEAVQLFNEARGLYENELTPVVLAINEAAKDITSEARVMIMYGLLEDCVRISSTINTNLESCMLMKIEDADASEKAAITLSWTLLIIILTVLVIAVVISIILAFYISSLISKPVKALSEFFNIAGKMGDIMVSPETEKAFNNYGQFRDEIGEMIKDCSAFIDHIINSAKNLETIANGDLTVVVKKLSESDTIGNSLDKMVDSMNTMFGEINSSSTQVDAGSKQIADGAQALSQGSTEQAASVEQLSSSISEIATQTQGNAELAEKAHALSESIRGNAEKGERQMDEMMAAVRDINAASQSISKVIKVIDDIAFQTNILALNAAVEAARAGQHGKGFAVVAEEVRNLAAKSAEAAKETGDMIQNSMEKAELGSRIASETAVSFTEISTGIQESSQLVADIAASSKEQAMGISQVNIGIDQVAQVVQQNSATAQESAAASEEMSGQSAMLQELISQFKLKK